MKQFKIIRKFISFSLIIGSFITLVSCLFPDIDKKYLYQQIDEIISTIDVLHITNDINLPDEYNNVKVSWESDNSNLRIVDNIGIVQRKDTDILVTLTAKFTYKNFKVTDYYTLVIKNTEWTNEEIQSYSPNVVPMNLISDKLKQSNALPSTPMITPSESESNQVLVIPIEFVDYTFTDEQLVKLNKAFFGGPDEVLWESVQSYFQKTSYGNLDINGTVLPPFTVNKFASAFYESEGKDAADQNVLKQALKYYDDEYDFSRYDVDEDGIIDAVYLIYAKPYKKTSNSAEDSFWWAYHYYFGKYKVTVDGVSPSNYIWASYDFINDLSYKELSAFGANPGKLPNSSTYIHETGHLLGLIDYYDYDTTEGSNGGLGKTDMMESNIGDEAAFSKIFLGWTKPMIVTISSVIKIRPFESSGQVLMIPAKWSNSKDDYFQEFYLLDYYTPTGLNAPFKGINLFASAGLRITHANAQAGNNGGKFNSAFLYDNSYTTYTLLDLVDPTGANRLQLKGNAEANLYDMLFLPKKIYNPNIFPYISKPDKKMMISIQSMTEDELVVEINLL